LFGGFFLFFYAKLLSVLLVLGLVLPTFILDYAVIGFLHVGLLPIADWPGSGGSTVMLTPFPFLISLDAAAYTTSNAAYRDV